MAALPRTLQNLWTSRSAIWLRRLRRTSELGIGPADHREIDGAIERLRDTDRALGRTFTTLSESFVPLHDRITALLKQCDELVVLASGRRDGMTLFQEAVQLLHDPIEYIDFCVGQHERLLELFVNTERRMKNMLEFQRRMGPMLAPLTYIEVLVKIESASLEPEQRDTFLNVVAEIERLHTLVNETFDKNTALLTETHQTLERVRTKLQTDFERHARHTAERRLQIEGAIASLDEQLHSDKSREVKIQLYSRELARQIGAIVTAVQAQDIVSQKTGHVLEALAEIKDDDTGAGHLLELQAAQVGQIGADVDHAGTAIRRCIDDIRRQTEEIDQNALKLDEFTQMTASADGMVQQLLDAFSGVREIIDSTLVLTREADAATRPASKIAHSLTTTLGDLSINMRLIALNAQVRSLQITQGTGLEILAARTASISGEISEVSDLVARDLGQLREETDEMIKLLEAFSTRGLAQQPLLEAANQGTEHRLHELRNSALAVIGIIGDTATEIKATSASAEEALATLPANLATLGEASQLLRAHIEKLGHQPGQEACAKTRQRLEQQASRYTMHSERHVHQAGASPTGIDHQSTAARTLQNDSQEVDMFVDFEPAAQPEAAKETQPQAADRPAGPVPANLGSNVDLF